MTIHYTASDAVSALGQCQVPMGVVSEYHGEGIALYPGSYPFSERQRKALIGVFEPDQGALLEQALTERHLPREIEIKRAHEGAYKRRPRKESLAERNRVLRYIRQKGPCKRSQIKWALKIKDTHLDNALAWLRGQNKVETKNWLYRII